MSTSAESICQWRWWLWLALTHLQGQPTAPVGGQSLTQTGTKTTKGWEVGRGSSGGASPSREWSPPPTTGVMPPARYNSFSKRNPRCISFTEGPGCLARDKAWLPLGFWIFYDGEFIVTNPKSEKVTDVYKTPETSHQMASFLTIAFPLAARTSVHLALAARILLGWYRSQSIISSMDQEFSTPRPSLP